MQQTSPFHQRTFDIAVTKQVADEFVFRSRVSHQFTHHFRCACAVLYRHAHGQITRIIGAASPEKRGPARTFARSNTRSLIGYVSSSNAAAMASPSPPWKNEKMIPRVVGLPSCPTNPR